MNIGLIIVGDEILSGKRQDKHLAKFIELLSVRGLGLTWARYVGDDRARITEVLQHSFAGGDLVLCCGGIGATPDDHTRQCAAAAAGVDLVLHPQAEGLIRERMQDVAKEQGLLYEPERPDNVHRLNMGVFPAGARIIPNPYNKIPGFSVGHLHFVPGFPVMAWPMMAWVLDELYGALHGAGRCIERSVIVFGAMEASLTPLMEQTEALFPGVRVFSLPSVDHPTYGKHIELGVKASADPVLAFAALKQGLTHFGAELGPEMVR